MLPTSFFFNKFTLAFTLITTLFIVGQNLVQAESNHSKQNQHTTNDKQHELLVKFIPNTPANKINAIHNTIGVTVIQIFKSTGVQHIKFPNNITLKKALNNYRSQAEVLYAEPNQTVNIVNP